MKSFKKIVATLISVQLGLCSPLYASAQTQFPGMNEPAFEFRITSIDSSLLPEAAQMRLPVFSKLYKAMSLLPSQISRSFKDEEQLIENNFYYIEYMGPIRDTVLVLLQDALNLVDSNSRMGCSNRSVLGVSVAPCVGREKLVGAIRTLKNASVDESNGAPSTNPFFAARTEIMEALVAFRSRANIQMGGDLVAIRKLLKAYIFPEFPDAVSFELPDPAVYETRRYLNNSNNRRHNLTSPTNVEIDEDPSVVSRQEQQVLEELERAKRGVADTGRLFDLVGEAIDLVELGDVKLVDALLQPIRNYLEKKEAAEREAQTKQERLNRELGTSLLLQAFMEPYTLEHDEQLRDFIKHLKITVNIASEAVVLPKEVDFQKEILSKLGNYTAFGGAAVGLKADTKLISSNGKLSGWATTLSYVSDFKTGFGPNEFLNKIFTLKAALSVVSTARLMSIFSSQTFRSGLTALAQQPTGQALKSYPLWWFMAKGYSTANDTGSFFNRLVQTVVRRIGGQTTPMPPGPGGRGPIKVPLPGKPNLGAGIPPSGGRTSSHSGVTDLSQARIYALSTAYRYLSIAMFAAVTVEFAVSLSLSKNHYERLDAFSQVGGALFAIAPHYLMASFTRPISQAVSQTAGVALENTAIAAIDSAGLTNFNSLMNARAKAWGYTVFAPAGMPDSSANASWLRKVLSRVSGESSKTVVRMEQVAGEAAAAASAEGVKTANANWLKSFVAKIGQTVSPAWEPVGKVVSPAWNYVTSFHFLSLIIISDAIASLFMKSPLHQFGSWITGGVYDYFFGPERYGLDEDQMRIVAIEDTLSMLPAQATEGRNANPQQRWVRLHRMIEDARDNNSMLEGYYTSLNSGLKQKFPVLLPGRGPQSAADISRFAYNALQVYYLMNLAHFNQPMKHLGYRFAGYYNYVMRQSYNLCSRTFRSMPELANQCSSPIKMPFTYNLDTVVRTE
ncbi:MAG: hypothetical protein COT74_12860 [Bdellovibrionales bacterium CG10_big_fil_rev_8_21_14_0_10_45_34]|nr:MAG: hypothetical protein COT74_12860 [Bdellovibrionales bacterium CG10_big_fil_rev_8_21_14_0_10_45_34]